jgi:hypothetical protein
MIALKYRLISSCAAVDETDCRKVIQLPAGTVIFPDSTRPDVAGMIEGVCDGHTMKVFACDLEERAERVEIRKPPATVRCMSSASR